MTPENAMHLNSKIKCWHRLQTHICKWRCSFLFNGLVPHCEDNSSLHATACSGPFCLFPFIDEGWPVTISDSFSYMNSKCLWIENYFSFTFLFLFSPLFLCLTEKLNMNLVRKLHLVLHQMLSSIQFPAKCPGRRSTWGIRAVMGLQNFTVKWGAEV